MSFTHAVPQLVRDYVAGLEPEQGIWINGQARRGGKGTFEVLDPASGQLVANIADGDEADVKAAVDAAAAAFPTWREVPPRQRAELLRKVWTMMIERTEELAQLMSWEMGKALPDARGEVAYAAEFFRWFAEEAVRSEGDYAIPPAGGARLMVTNQPVGVAALITPWNFPAAMATRKIGPALAAGCTVVLKAASDTPLTALAVVKLIHEAGVPAGVVNLVSSSKSSMVSRTWLDDPRVRVVSFTGSTQVGKVLMEQAVQRVVNLSMELGGNASFVVGPSADVDAAVEGALVAKFRNGGQACTAANRFYVHAAVAEEFLEKFGAKIAAFKVGGAFEEGVEVAAVVNAKAHGELMAKLERAIGAGATVVAQAPVNSQAINLVPPTLLKVSDPQAEILQEEIFGPIAPVYVWEDEAEMLRLVNGTEYGLASYVFGDLQWALRIAEKIEAGMIGVNRGLVSDPAAPFGGMKQSGIGREGAREGIREFQETQYFSVAW